ncbi:Bol3 protein [Maudiozyma humilis]|uniref:Bol3 protein n=1 Tax=Maudiozyma humilis TaxID=51915 RepID=A0AAV5RQC4_MAUHU|nr:Bol3 protein [Kazachstania humilis]
MLRTVFGASSVVARGVYPTLKGHTVLKQAFLRCISSKSIEEPVFETAEEKSVYKKLQEALNPSHLSVHDISGGCGSMYNIVVKSKSFNELTTIKQHKLVNSILKDEIGRWHGLQLSTKKDK